MYLSCDFVLYSDLCEQQVALEQVDPPILEAYVQH